MFRRVRRWWFYHEASSAAKALTLTPVVAGLAIGGWLAATGIASDDEAQAVAYYEVTTERMVTVRVTESGKPKVKVVRQVKRVYVDPDTQTVRLTRLITKPVTSVRVVTRNGAPITVAETVVSTRDRTLTRTRTSTRTAVLTKTAVETRTQRETTTERETTTQLATSTRQVTTTRQVPTTVRSTTTVPVTTTNVVTATRPVTTTVRTTVTTTTTRTVTVPVPTTVTVTRTA